MKRLLGGGHGNPLQCSCLENPMGKGAWPAVLHGVAQSQTRLKRLSTYTCNGICSNVYGPREYYAS